MTSASRKSNCGGGTGKTRKTSLPIFRKYIKRLPSGELDASQLKSTRCFMEWVETHVDERRSDSTIEHALKVFRRTLIAHVTGTDGRDPLSPEEEAAVLIALRQKEQWECFSQNGVVSKHSGFRAAGFHEKLRAKLLTAPKKLSKKARLMVVEDHQEQNYESDENSSKAPIESAASSQNEADQKSPPSGSSNLSAYLQSSYQCLDQIQNIPFHLDSANASAVCDTVIPESQRTTPVLPLGILDCAPPPFLTHICLQEAARLYSVIDGWRNLHTLARLVLLGMGFSLTANLDDAKTLTESVSLKHPGQYVMILNHLERDFRNKFMFQNDFSRIYFGRITAEDGGTVEKRFLPEAYISMVGTILAAYIAKGSRECRIVWKLKTLRHGYRLFESFYCCDPQLGLMIERGAPIDGLDD